jgi:hypothetical protein
LRLEVRKHSIEVINYLDIKYTFTGASSLVRSTANVPEKTHAIAHGGSASLQILAYLPDVYLILQNHHEQVTRQPAEVLIDYYKKQFPFSVCLIDLLMRMWYLDYLGSSFIAKVIGYFDRRYFQKFHKLDVNRPGDANEYLSAMILLSLEDGDGSEKKEESLSIDMEKLFCFKSQETFGCQCGVASSKEVAMTDLKARFPVLKSADSLARSDLRLEKMIHPPASVARDEDCAASASGLRDDSEKRVSGSFG